MRCAYASGWPDRPSAETGRLEALDALRRIAHLYAEIHQRLRPIGRNVARTLRSAVARIRELGLGEMCRGDLYSGDWKALERCAGFDAAYLYRAGLQSL